MLKVGDDNTPEKQFYWSLDLPGMTADQAVQVGSVIKDQGIDLEVLLVDPSNFLTLHLDRESVEAIVAGLTVVRSNPVNDSLRESLEDWLAYPER
ncbi:hypothetical protein [Micromonospora sp. NPDC048842]|uniref:hypothetical protein n=1 Tax=unclassified Micromonospora TaxID=2617518 RepID=UPI0033C84202